MANRSHKYLETALFLFFALFIFGSTFSIALAQMSLGVSLVLFLILVMVARYNPFVSSLRWFYLFVALYIFWMLLSALVGPTPLRSILIIKEEWLFCAIPIGVFLFGRRQYRHMLTTAFAAGVMLVSIYGIIQHFTGIHLFNATPPTAASDFGYLVCGRFSHSLTFGNYYGTASLFLAGLALAGHRQLSRQMRLFLISSSLLAMITTVLSYSRGPIAALAVGLVLLGLILGRRYLVYSLGTIAVAAVAILIIMPGLTGRFSGKTTKDFGGVYEGGRVFIWKNSLRVIQENPIFGVGQGNFKAAYSSHLRADIPEKRKHVHAHNDLLNVAAISGIPGAVFFLGMWLVAVGYFWKGWRMRQKMGRDSSISLRNRVGAGLVSAQDKELWRHKAATYAGPYHVWDNIGSDGTFALAALVGSVVFFVTSLFEATFADEEVRQMLMFIWAAGLWLWYKGSDREETITVKSA